MLGWRKQKLESRLLGEILTISDNADDTTLTAECEEELKSLVMKMKEKSEKAGLKLNIKKLKIMVSGQAHYFIAHRRKLGNSGRFSFPGSQNHCGQ